MTSFTARRDHHPLGGHGRAGRLQLRHLLDLDDADAAGSIDADAGVITVVGNRDARLDGGLEDGSALVDGNLAAVDRQRDGFHKLPIISHGIGWLANQE
jgi:hypothetical protein